MQTDLNATREPRRLALIDLDDTLLGPGKQISPPNRKAIDHLRMAGFEVVIASGRLHQNIVRFDEPIGGMGWVVSSQGAVVRHTRTNELLYEVALLEKEALEIYAAARSAELSIIVYHRDGVFIEQESEWTRLYGERAGWMPELVDLSKLAASGVQKVLLAQSKAAMASMRSGLESSFGKRFYLVETDSEITEVLSLRANKMFGAEAVARKLAVDRSNVVAFGDGYNDVELLSWAGFSVAMAHGRPEAQKAATRISPPGPPETAFARAVALMLKETGDRPVVQR
ncbi:MAG: HAD-superfamily hydrolase, subfamily [Chthoniobacteraceae bacterium]|nr:HAD-superfamily hydrolase, subfamily [Chthoniobacteraceae bacterium]